MASQEWAAKDPRKVELKAEEKEEGSWFRQDVPLVRLRANPFALGTMTRRSGAGIQAVPLLTCAVFASRNTRCMRVKETRDRLPQSLLRRRELGGGDYFLLLWKIAWNWGQYSLR